jgi:hypothetical protein
LELAFFSKELAELRTSLSVLLLLIVFSKTTSSQTFEYLPGAKYDPSIPTLKQITGHAWGEKITMHHEMERYARALEQSSGGRLKAIKYGETWEGKALYYFVIGSAQNLSRIDTIKTGIQRLADPRHLSTVEAGGLI